MILDLWLPTLSGDALLQEVAGREPAFLSKTIVVTTALPSHDGVLEHVAAVIRKPFPIAELMDTLRRCCDGDGDGDGRAR
jgi:DNA-binding NtrC family response regulator